MHSAFQYSHYTLRRQVLALTGKFRFYEPGGQLVMYSQQKMFRLKEDIRVYSDENRSQELLYIQARQILDFSAAYDVIDSFTNERIGVLRRKGFRSLLRDEWEVLDLAEKPIGILQEDNLALAMLRRFLLRTWLPQNYDLLVGGNRCVDIRQRFNLLRYELELEFSSCIGMGFDPRLGIASALLVATIEGRQG